MNKLYFLGVMAIGYMVACCGGGSGDTVPPASTDPATWSAASSLATMRNNHTATLLPNGKVLVAGGTFPSLTSSELYDLATNIWTATGSLTTQRGAHTATLLHNGKVLAASRNISTSSMITGLTATTELYW